MIEASRNLWIQSYASYKGLFLWLNWRAYLPTVLLWPALLMLTLSLLGRYAQAEDPQRLILGMTTYALPLMLVGGILQSFYYDRAFKTLPFVFISTANRLELFVSRALLHVPNALLGFAASLVAARLLLDLDFGAVRWDAFLASVLVVTASCTAFSLCIGNLSIAVRDFLTVRAVAAGLFLGLSGVVVPVDALPPVLQELAQALPVTHGLPAIVNTFAGAPLSEVTASLATEAAVGLGYFVAGYAVFRWMERFAIRRGSLLEID